MQKDCDFSITGHIGFDSRVPSRKGTIRSLKILRPEKDSILSRFWCGRCSKARHGAPMTSRKMRKFNKHWAHVFPRIRVRRFRQDIATLPYGRGGGFLGVGLSIQSNILLKTDFFDSLIIYKQSPKKKKKREI